MDRNDWHGWLAALPAASDDALLAGLASRLDAECVWHVAHPVGDLTGPQAVAAHWFAPLRDALPGALRRDEIVLYGRSRTGSGEWLACLGHLVGNLVGPLFGVAPHGKLVFLRCGEFYRVSGGRIVDAYLLPDLPDLARQAGRPVLPGLWGTEGLFPGPATHDGVCPDRPERSAASAQLVEAMLADLHAFDPKNFASAGQTGPGGYWHRDMLWFGPAGIGANFTYAGFDRDHRVPFLTAFPDRRGGNHFARFGGSDYVCSGGWPSMTMTHRGPYLNLPATGLPARLRVMDFWRVAAGQIKENWVLLDLPDLVAQLGVDLLGRSQDHDRRTVDRCPKSAHSLQRRVVVGSLSRALERGRGGSRRAGSRGCGSACPR